MAEPIKLRDGSEVQDARLARLKQFDERLLHEGGEAVIPMGRHKTGFLGALKKLVGR